MLIEPDNISLICCIAYLFIQTFKGALPYDFNVFPVQSIRPLLQKVNESSKIMS